MRAPISTEARIEQYYDHGEGKPREERFHFISATILVISLFFWIIDLFIVTLNISFFWEQNQVLEIIWFIFISVLFYMFPFRFLNKECNGFFFFWICVASLVIILTPILILGLKELALIYGF